VEHLKVVHSMCSLLALFATERRSSLFCAVVSNNKKRFYNVVTWSNFNWKSEKATSVINFIKHFCPVIYKKLGC
jgi:hypothetical protein